MLCRATRIVARPLASDDARRTIALAWRRNSPMSQAYSAFAMTIEEMPRLRAIVALGRIAHDSVANALGARRSVYPFGHGAIHAVGPLTVFDSYHCSRQNTNTGTLTTDMFRAVFAAVRAALDEVPA